VISKSKKGDFYHKGPVGATTKNCAKKVFQFIRGSQHVMYSVGLLLLRGSKRLTQTHFLKGRLENFKRCYGGSNL
jgi:hypothetical protein